jgi:hypothetical protein
MCKTTCSIFGMQLGNNWAWTKMKYDTNLGLVKKIGNGYSYENGLIQPKKKLKKKKKKKKKKRKNGRMEERR